MAQRDVVLRWIEQIARVVRRMLQGPGPPDLAAARIHLEAATAQLLGPLALLVPQLDIPSAAALLHDPERILGLALLLDLSAEVAEAEADAAAAAAGRARAAAFRRAAGACPQCGACYADEARSCAERFQALLALDHSRAAPWGPLHGVVFACYTLQHPEGQTRAALERCWIALHRLVAAGDAPAKLFESLRRSESLRPEDWGTPPLPPTPPPGGPYEVTIAHLGDFAADGYAQHVEAWARASYARWSGKR